MTRTSLQVVTLTRGEASALFAVARSTLDVYQDKLTPELVADLKSGSLKLMQLMSTRAEKVMAVA